MHHNNKRLNLCYGLTRLYYQYKGGKEDLSSYFTIHPKAFG